MTVFAATPGQLRATRETTRLASVFERSRDPKHPPFRVAVELGKDGFAGAWVLDVPGCWALVPPGSDVAQRASLAIVEFAAWSHNRSAERAALDPVHIDIVQTVTTGEDLRAGESSAFFGYDADLPAGNEFPVWAHPHDRALDELRELALSLPPAIQEHPLDETGRTIRSLVEHAAETERYLATCLRPDAKPRSPGSGRDAQFRVLQDAHLLLQEVVCDAPRGVRTSPGAVGGGGPMESWSVRKVMRRSIWHLRYHTWELRREISGIWLG